MRILQLNLNHCEAAQDLLSQSIRELDIDVAILCEQYRDYRGATWVSDASGRAAVWTCGRSPVQETMQVPASGFVWARVEGIYMYSVYAPPSASIEQFEALLDRLAGDVRGRRPVIVAGDFNAWAMEWGSRRTNRRGEALLDALASLDIILVNSGDKATFTRGDSGFIVDLTFASECLMDSGLTWKVCDSYTHSDHRAILCVVAESTRYGKATVKSGGSRWSARALDGESFVVMVEEETTFTGQPDDMTEQLMTHIIKACDASMPRTSGRSHRPPVY